ncbi:riboflavin synthase, alpha subunit [Fusobacterium necrophorum subsp. funduliforme 1_1_36S]|uniref:Riboflavin synthase n=1 Tax=Fusobacterium necrophorum subsp. funduliforme B35 TaxID=1226633 RepID=A0A0B4FRR4_9FUSO|nr:riboflavin synthase, alpha subunit [Fusobacterium necrophorum subsp. funduliforme 1_1_36S]KID50172.1 riboflavin synthase subunit alpha [Fusobacterium necrophorum subsp. funduliforme B35]
MFTGLVEEMGRVLSITEGNHSMQIKIQCKKVLEGAKLGDSIATNGTCLTAVEIGKNYFVADCMHETMKRTNLHRLKKSDFVNLEKSITLSTPLGGHLVTGDVDCEGKIIEIRQDGIAKIYTVELPKQYMKYVVEKGRVTLDGASLTVMELGEYTLGVSLIPHSQEMIILGKKKVGDYINVETDLIGKYVEKLLSFPKQEEKTLN